MALLNWSSEFSVGIEIIDKQHMILVRAINLLAMAVERNGSQELMSEIFHTLVDYTNTHFAYEEELFDYYGYPQTDKHKQEHKALLEKVLAFKRQWESGQADLGPEVLKFLVDWLRHHILGSDKKYTGFLVEAMQQAHA
ncbi:MAG TPA: bacteriohemerythrin [Hyphomicrobiales bacterium]|nr:bacteriohemerythrin [Kaistiaceae bacterium]HQF30947.1 bacteriohemerythrin [Hyphomicrobiales bacterium]